MTGARLELANPHTYSSPREYIEQHLAPAVAELHRITNELLAPGATSAEEFAVDMVPSGESFDYFSRLDRRLDDSPKHVIFDGSGYFSLPKELLRAKQVKVQLCAAVYVKGGSYADFRLVRDDGVVIRQSLFRASGPQVETVTRTLPFGDEPGCVSADSRTYYLEGGAPTPGLPVCRRFSLSFVYI